MRRRSMLCALLLPLAAIAQDAGSGAEVENFGDHLRIAFDQPMQILHGKLDAAAVRTRPALPLDCSWQSDTHLYCEMGERAKPATPYIVEIAPGLRTVTGHELPRLVRTVETQRPDVLVRLQAWDDERPVYRLWVTAAVTQAALREALRAEVDGHPVTPVLLPIADSALGDADGEFELLPPSTGAESRFRLEIVPGLRSSEGPLRGKQSGLVAHAVVDEPFQLRAALCAGEDGVHAARGASNVLELAGCVPSERMRLVWSRQPDPAAWKAWMSHWPAGARWIADGREDRRRWREAEPDIPDRAPGWFVDFTVDESQARVDLEVPALPTRTGGASLPPMRVRIGTVQPRPSLVAAHRESLLADPGPDRASLQALMLTPARLDLLAVGRQVSRTAITTPAAGQSPVPVQPRRAIRVLRQGGLVEYSPAPGVAVRAAAPSFDLQAVAGNHAVLVWASAWENGVPVADAEIELLGAPADDVDPRVVARGRTQADGTALLELPAGMDLPTPNRTQRWWVRAQHGRRLAVLPLGAALWTQALLQDHPRQAFGVSDRPVYRAGDVVRWQLWQRELRDGAWGIPDSRALTMQLLGPDWNDVASWTAMADTGGAIHGATPIPIYAPDGEYCIAPRGIGSRWSSNGKACFFVGTFRAHDLWLRTRAGGGLLRPGATLAFDVEAGYYSGGVAAHAQLDRIQASLEPTPIPEAFPRYEGYEFARPDERVFIRDIEGVEGLRLSTDAMGRAHVQLPLRLATRSCRPSARSH